jgi:PsbP-like protein
VNLPRSALIVIIPIIIIIAAAAITYKRAAPLPNQTSTTSYTATPRQKSGNETTHWKTFSSKEGWSIQYPSDWQVGSCVDCGDDLSDNISGFITFDPPQNSQQGRITISPVENKPSTESNNRYFQELATTLNLKTISEESPVTLANSPALQVDYSILQGGSVETTYLIQGSHAFEIEFSGDGSDIKTLGNYPTYQKIIATFRFNVN